MPEEVFINYRTGDGEDVAALVEHYLSERFGTERIFRASKSIKPGDNFKATLASALEPIVVLLAIIGPRWSGDSRLHDPDDWVRRELIAVHDCGGHVIPVLNGRLTERLDASGLPAELDWLADTQYLRLDARDSESGLRRIGDEIAIRVPSLKDADQQEDRSSGNSGTRNTAGEIDGPVVQGRDIGGNAGTTINGNPGILNSGSGSVYQNSPQFSSGGTYIAGDNRGGVTHHSSRKGQEEAGE